jgi:hypothetical protein
MVVVDNLDKGNSMKNILMIMGVFGVLTVASLVEADSAAISFTSQCFDTTTYKYASSKEDYNYGRDVVAYILNSSGGFVRTIAVWGKDLADISPWKTVSTKNVVDAVSAATVNSTSGIPLTASWDGKDVNKTAVAPGVYWLVISATAKDFDNAPPTLKVKFEVGGLTKTITTADSSLNKGSTYLTNLNVAYTGSTKVISQAISGNQLLVKIGNSKIFVPFNNEKTFNVSFFSLNGVRLMQQIIPVKSNGEISNVPAAFQTPGTYICRITSKSTIVSKKIAF